MQLSVGTRLGPYEILAAIGAGGMGEVYRANDTRLNRSVAIKVLPREFAVNAQLKQRFEREAKTISQLNHPHICTLHDVGTDNGVEYLVMEYLEGESLADRLIKGPLPIGEVLRYGMQIAEALDKAHRAGVVHRDLKPGNIMLTKSGAKLLDFGLAKSAELERSADAATQHKLLTQEGTILGTFQYMAPEQLAGADADARTDIFALGAVLYEIATGKHAFEGKTRTSLVAAIISGEPIPMRTLQPLAPPAFEHVVAKCLAKEPDDRWQSAHDIAEELRWTSEAGSQAGVPFGTAIKRRHREAFTIGLAALLAIATIVTSAMYVGEKKRAERVVITDLIPPAGTHFNIVGNQAGPPVVSPDGKYVVFSVAEASTKRLWIRTLGSGEVKPLNSTEGAMFPFWSPDSRNIGYFVAGGELKRVDISGGAPINLAPATSGRGGSWGRDDVILFSPSTLAPLFRIPASGGKPVQVTQIEHRHTSHRWPSFLPDGKHFVYLAANHQDATGGSNAVYLGSIDGGESRLVINTPLNAVYSRGHLLFVRDTTLYAQEMSTAGVLSGEVLPVAQDVLNDGGIWRGGFSLTDTGDLAYCSGQATQWSRVVWVDRTGKELGTLGEHEVFWDVQLSPDQKKLLLGIGDPSRQVWISDLAKKTRTRLDFGARWVGLPVWFPDGSTVMVDAIRDDGFALITKRIDGGVPRVVMSRPSRETAGAGIGGTISPDGKTIVLSADRVLWKAPVDRSDQASKLTPEAMNARDPRFSPDGKWLAFVSGENGSDDVFIALASDMGRKWQVSERGGTQPSWRRNGKEIFYIDAKNRLTAVEINTSNDSLEIGNAQPLFPVESTALARVYDVSADGQRFVINRQPDETTVGVKIMTNWEKVPQR